MMPDYDIDLVRNVVLLSHSGAGKTSLAEAMLFHSKAIPKLGRVEDGNTTSDYEPEEIKRGVSINLSILPCEWQGKRINFIDTPGYADFISEVKAGLKIAEGAVIVVCAASGVEVGTESAWRYAEEMELPRVIFINKMDRENANFYHTFEQIERTFDKKCLPIQLPIGAAASFQGIIDLTSEENIPEAVKDEFSSFRERLLEAVAETDDALTVKYLEGEKISLEEIQQALKEGVRARKLVPVLVGSAWQGQGIAELLKAITFYIPSPGEANPISAVVGSAGEIGVIQPKVEAPLVAQVFKTTADPYVGKLTYFRVYSGTIPSNSQIWNANKSQSERVGQLFSIRGKSQQPVPSVIAGDVGAVAKLVVTNTGDTFSDKEHPIILPPIEFPKPIFSVALYPKTKQDVDKMGTILPRLLEEDPTLEVRREPDTGETLLSGIGDTQVEVAVERMQRKFGLEVIVATPKVPYKETILASTKAEYKHKKQTGGHGQYGHVSLELEPLPGGGFEFVDRIVGGAISKKYVTAVEKGVIESLQEGVLTKHPVTDLRVSLYDGSEHSVDSSDISFKIAGAQAIKKGLSQAQPVLLEPIMHVTVIVPEAFLGEITGDLNTKRAKVLGISPEDGKQVVEAYVPLAEILRYTIDLRSITQGQGSYSAEFSHYEEVPPHLAQKIIEQKASEK
jgi:elongation factor G